MIYLTLFWEFFKIGLFAVGGGLATVPFLYGLAVQYGWFGSDELANMIAVSESTPGPLGVNMSTYAGFKTAGIAGGLTATSGLILPSMIVIILLACYLRKHPVCQPLEYILKFVRPAVLALICAAGIIIARVSLTNYVYAVISAVMFLLIHLVKKSPIFYIILGAVGGLIWG